jgi:enoyl-CoA hydratase/carnithine racemase
VTYETILVERRGAVRWIIFNRPDPFNALNLPMFDELEQAWTELDADDDVRVIVVTGTGKGFCSGADLKDLAEDPRGMTVYADRVRLNTLRFTSYHCRVWKPVICAVNGVCAGGGLHFVADSDIVMATAAATFLDPHTSVGQVATYETIGLRVRMPFEAVSRMLLVGKHERMTADRAMQLGMISQIEPDVDALHAAAQELGEKIALNSPTAMMVSKKALWESLDLPFEEALARSALRLADFWRHPDNREGPAAFAEGRDPTYLPPTRTFLDAEPGSAPKLD